MGIWTGLCESLLKSFMVGVDGRFGASLLEVESLLPQGHTRWSASMVQVDLALKSDPSAEGTECCHARSYEKEIRKGAEVWILGTWSH